jgi:hypothetical protein
MFFTNFFGGDIVYDIEVYPNVFLFFGVHLQSKQKFSFEISEFKDDTRLFKRFMNKMAEQNEGIRYAEKPVIRMIGFNNINYDYPIIHHIVSSKITLSNAEIYEKSKSIIESNERFANNIRVKDHIVPQVDLVLIHHFEATSLKSLEIFMRSESIQDLPYEPHTSLNRMQIKKLKLYNRHDVYETMKFTELSKRQIEFRDELSAQTGMNLINKNDTKIGANIFIQRMEEFKPGVCYTRQNGRKVARQTQRKKIVINDIILPHVFFETTEFLRILGAFKSKTITNTKGELKDLKTVYRGVPFKFGTGGIHASVKNQAFCSDDDWIIEDWDVTSYYPNMSIANRLYPQHLGAVFCDIYEFLFNERKKYPKGSAENAMLKLALNGVFGDSNSKYSPFFDPKYTMSITINGQLLIAMLCETLMSHPEIQLIQANTDGLTIRYPRKMQNDVKEIMTWFEDYAGFQMESKEFDRMFVRDVNNYLVLLKELDENGNQKIKRKGAYEYEIECDQDPSQLIVPKAAEAYLLFGTDIREFIENHDDIFDFFIRAKASKGAYLQYGNKKIQKISRYFVSKNGEILRVVRPPTQPEGTYKRKNKLSDQYYAAIKKEVGDAWDERIHTKSKSTYQWVESKQCGGLPTTLCNNISDVNEFDFDYDYYVDEVEKLTNIYE